MYGGETSDELPQRELHVFLQLALDVLRRTQKNALGRGDDSVLTFLVEDISSGSMGPRLSDLQRAAKFDGVRAGLGTGLLAQNA